MQAPPGPWDVGKAEADSKLDPAGDWLSIEKCDGKEGHALRELEVLLAIWTPEKNEYNVCSQSVATLR